MNKRKLSASLLAISLATSLWLGLLSASASEATNGQQIPAVSAQAEKHGQAALDLIKIVQKDPQAKVLLEKSLAKAAAINPDHASNPCQSLDELYKFMDWAETCMPWNVLDGSKYPTLFEKIDQSIDYFWFVVDQPLEELKGKNYYYPTLQYHEPFASWIKQYSKNWGAYLSTPDSWKAEYSQQVLQEKRFNLDKGWYESPTNWHSFNDFFARRLASPAVRPIAGSNDDSIVVFPADSQPQGIWNIDENGNIIHRDGSKGVAPKTATFLNIAQILGNKAGKYVKVFAGGILTHAFLNVDDYHRYHFPVSGKIVSMEHISAVNGAGGVTLWDAKTGKYVLECDVPGWQFIETRDSILVDTKKHGLVAIMPIGMSQISSCNFEPNLKVGNTVAKGDPLGYFLFGGSDVVMLFQKEAGFKIHGTPDSDGIFAHGYMGEEYGVMEGTK